MSRFATGKCCFRGTLNQQIDNHWQGQPFGTSHSIRTEKGSVVERLFGQASRINSVHRQSIKDLAPNFRATAFDPRDNTIEAIESIDNHRIIGLQWHPEFWIGEEKGNLELFHYLCRNYKNFKPFSLLLGKFKVRDLY